MSKLKCFCLLCSFCIIINYYSVNLFLHVSIERMYQCNCFPYGVHCTYKWRLFVQVNRQNSMLRRFWNVIIIIIDSQLIIALNCTRPSMRFIALVFINEFAQWTACSSSNRDGGTSTQAVAPNYQNLSSKSIVYIISDQLRKTFKLYEQCFSSSLLNQ